MNFNIVGPDVVTSKQARNRQLSVRSGWEVSGCQFRVEMSCHSESSEFLSDNGADWPQKNCLSMREMAELPEVISWIKELNSLVNF